jgi:RPA family protein
VSGREPAWRVFAGELAASLEEDRGTGERAASFVVSPLGARMNRVLLAGMLGPAEAAGRDPAQPFWRARLVDPTGTVTVTAGGFQPRALAALQGFVPAGPAVVVGKVHLFHARDGTTSASVRAEELRPAPPEEVRALQRETLAQTLERIELLERTRRGEESRPDAPPAPAAWVAAARSSLERYPSTDIGAFRQTLRAVLAPGADAPGPAPPAPTTRQAPLEPVVRRVAAPLPAPKPAPHRDHAHEALFLDLIDELCEHSDDGYADLRDAQQRAAARGVSPEAIEEILNRLEESGVLEEPIVGKIRRA